MVVVLASCKSLVFEPYDVEMSHLRLLSNALYCVLHTGWRKSRYGVVPVAIGQGDGDKTSKHRRSIVVVVR